MIALHESQRNCQLTPDPEPIYLVAIRHAADDGEFLASRDRRKALRAARDLYARLCTTVVRRRRPDTPVRVCAYQLEHCHKLARGPGVFRYELPVGSDSEFDAPGHELIREWTLPEWAQEDVT